MQDVIGEIRAKRQSLDEALAETRRQLAELEALPRSRESVEKMFLNDIARRCAEFEARTDARIQAATKPNAAGVLDLLWNLRSWSVEEDGLTYLFRPELEKLIRERVTAVLPAGGISDPERERRRAELQAQIEDLTRQQEALQAELKDIAA
jgi:hypothetical protein